jgi:hypothetical protein
MLDHFVPAVVLLALYAGACTNAPPGAREGTDAARETGVGGDGACGFPEHLDVGAPDGAADCGNVPVTILGENCVGGICHHAGQNPSGHLNLLSPCVADRLVGVPSSCSGRLLVDPDAPARSFILDKLENDKPECGGARMPFMNRLPDAKIECVKRWVYAVSASARP